MNIDNLVVVAHPDDEILGFGGTAAVLTERGETAKAAILCGNVEARTQRPEDNELAEDIEAANATVGMQAPALGAFPNIRLNTVPHIELVQFIEAQVEAFQPRRIFTHHPADLNDDHRQVSRACLAASRLFQRRADLRPVESVHFMEIQSATDWALDPTLGGFTPNLFVDLGFACRYQAQGTRMLSARHAPVPASAQRRSPSGPGSLPRRSERHRHVGGVPDGIQSWPQLMYRKVFKRMIDVLAALGVIVILSPLLLLIAVLIKVTDPGPVFFVQDRTGRYGKTFRFIKFRSMPVNTKNLASDELGEVKIGIVGRFIRRTNIDELPQLINVLKGDMSLVGPRPPIPSQEELIALRAENGALDCVPGLTGLAQVRSFDGMSVEEKARFDGDYANRITFFGDARIVLSTVVYLFKPPPVY